jgi:hypothetical protein
MKRSLLVVALAVTGVFAGAPEALADDVECIGTLSGPIHGNVVVPSGVECILEGAEVFGNALAQPESMLFMEESGVHGSVEVKALAHTGALGSSIDGNYKCDDCFFEDVIESEVGGSVQIKGADDGDFIQASVIHGNIEIVGSSAGAFAFIIQDSTIGGDLKFEKNQGPTVIGSGGPGGGNTIGGDLQIFDNNIEGVFCPPDAPPEECPFFENGLFNGNVVGGNMQLFKNHGPTESSATRSKRISSARRTSRRRSAKGTRRSRRKSSAPPSEADPLSHERGPIATGAQLRSGLRIWILRRAAPGRSGVRSPSSR